ncbi:MAG TPA: GNAT family N-acetyltransferase [Terriglobales bacterium]|nr:GNAT family N-acetyltransferase [Terriglobales bacterium]
MAVRTQARELTIAQAASDADISAARELFIEYANSLGFSLCFQGFDQELASLPGKYAPPAGRLLLALVNGQVAGCGCLRPLAGADVSGQHVGETALCEMKRLYVRRAFRGMGIGRKLALALMDEARQIGYAKMRLDTVADVMAEAVALYRVLGFYEIAPYITNPQPSTLYMEFDLANR